MKQLILIGVILVLPYALFWLIFSIVSSSANEEWYQEFYVNQEIEGELNRIHEYSDDGYRIALEIKNNLDQSELSYRVVCVDKQFRDYVAIGDSISKAKGSKTLFFCKSENDCRAFELIFCE